MAAISQYLSYAAKVGVFSEFHRLASKIIPLLQKNTGGMAAMGQSVQAQLGDRLSPEKNIDQDGIQKGDFLSKLRRLHEENPDKVTMNDVFMTCMTNIGAGSDTTSISLSSVVYHLCKNPLVAERLRKEISDMTESGEISDPVTFQQGQKMPYLQAVSKEALRMHPATGLPLGRVVREGGAVIAGRQFPGGVGPIYQTLLNNIMLKKAPEYRWYQFLGRTRK